MIRPTGVSLIKNIIRTMEPIKISRSISSATINDHLRSIYAAAIQAVQPKNLLRKHVSLVGDELHIAGERYQLHGPCHVVGFGKAVLGMALELETILGSRIAQGIVTVPLGIGEQFQPGLSRIQIIEGARDNLPDEAAMSGAKRIKKLCDTLREDDLLIVLISGGGSALLPLPTEGVRLEEKLWLIKELGNRGADILELNSVRKRVSQLKGGGLAQAAYPAKVVSLILSDVIGDPIDFIASGPTVPNQDSDDRVTQVLDKFGLSAVLPKSIHGALSNRKPEVPASFPHVKNFIIGSNRIACDAAKRHAEQLGYEAAIISTAIQGDVAEISALYTDLIACVSTAITGKEKLSEIANSHLLNLEVLGNLKLNSPVCLIAGGEITVRVSGRGKGGRNQQLALQVSEDLSKKSAELRRNVWFLSCGTDGIDGPTDAAGALGSSCLKASSVLASNININKFLEENDSYNFFVQYRNGENLVKIGHTGTNVMDVHVIVIQ